MRSSHNNRRPFTLVELLIGLALLFVISSLFFVNIRLLFVEETFKTSSYRLLSLCRNGSDLSQILHIDTEMAFFPREGKVDVHFLPIGSVTASYDRWFQSMKISLDGVDSIVLNSEKPTSELFFNDRGFDFSEGVLTLEKEDSRAYILLPGYPTPLHLTFDPIDFQEFKKRTLLFEEALSLSTFREIQASEVNVQKES